MDATKLEIIINYIKKIGSLAIKEAAIFNYLLIIACMYILSGSSEDIKNRLKKQLAILLLLFSLYCLWRLYLYFFTFSPIEALRGASLIRYIGIFCTAFLVIPCVSLKMANINDLEKIKPKILLTLALFSFMIITNRSILKINFASDLSREYDNQIKIVTELIKDGHAIEFNFANKTDTLDCYRFNYKLPPYSTQNYRDQCFKTPITENKILPSREKYLLFHQVIKTEQQLLKEKCTFIYYPFLLKIELGCKN